MVSWSWLWGLVSFVLVLRGLSKAKDSQRQKALNFGTWGLRAHLVFRGLRQHFSGGSCICSQFGFLGAQLSSNALSVWFLRARAFGLLGLKQYFPGRVAICSDFFFWGLKQRYFLLVLRTFFLRPFMTENTKDSRFYLSFDKTIEEPEWDTWFLDGFGSDAKSLIALDDGSDFGLLDIR